VSWETTLTDRPTPACSIGSGTLQNTGGLRSVVASNRIASRLDGRPRLIHENSDPTNPGYAPTIDASYREVIDQRGDGFDGSRYVLGDGAGAG